MSMSWYRWAVDLRGLKPPQKAVLIELADRFNDDLEVAYPSMENMAERTGYNRTTVLRALKALRDLGLVSWEQVRYKGHFAHNRYALHRVAERHVSECQLACENITELQQAQPPSGKEQHKPFHKPLIKTLTMDGVSKGNVKQRASKQLSVKQVDYAKSMAEAYLVKYKGDYLSYHSMHKDLCDYLLSDQSHDAWVNIGNGLASPKELGLMT